MAKVKQGFGETRSIQGGREVKHGEVIDVPGDELPSYLEGGWLPGDKAATDEHQRLLAEGVVTVGTLRKAKAKAEPEPEPEPAADTAEAEGDAPAAGDQDKEE